MMKNKSWALLILALVCAALLSGCQLALPENEESADRFIGLSVILSNGSETDRHIPHEVDGQVLILPIETNEIGEVLLMSDSGEWFSDVHMSIHTKDSGEERKMEGTLYVCDELVKPGVILKAEEVYQRADGSMYAVNAGHNYSGHLSGLTMDISQSHTTTDSEGNETSESCHVTLRILSEAQVLSAELIEMNSSNQEIARHTLDEQTEIILSAEADWALLSEALADGSTRRTALNPPFEEADVEIRRANEQGVCVPRSYKITSASK